MPTLNWIGKEAVVNHDKEVPFRLLKKVKAHSVGENSQNLIIHGDNLEALKALMPYYQGKIKCIYIDPPYNTGNESWVYNDKVNSPKIKKWLGKVVGGESEDLCRHDKWLCMMYPRLKLLRDLLSEDGLIFISLDEHEYHHLICLLNEIFGEENFIGTFIWKSKVGGGNDNKYLVPEHEYITLFSKTIKTIDYLTAPPDEEYKKVFRLKDEYFEERGYYYIDNLHKTGLDTNRPNLKYSIECPDGSKLFPPTIWRLSKEEFEKRKKNGEIVFKKTKEKGWQVYSKTYLNYGGIERRIRPRSVLRNVGTTREGNQQIIDIFQDKIFQYPKPYQLIQYFTSIATSKDDLILASFAGSGTTAHAILDLNKEDGGKRKFILIEMEDKVAKDITAERVKRIIRKNDYKAGFEFCELDKPLFNEEGQIEEECSFEQLATYIYFTETNTNLDKKLISGNSIGNYNDTEYYLLYKEKGKNIFNKDFLKKISKNSQKKVVYADKCLIDDRALEKQRIQFKQIPYEVKVY